MTKIPSGSTYIASILYMSYLCCNHEPEGGPEGGVERGVLIAGGTGDPAPVTPTR